MILVSSGSHRWASSAGQGAAGGLAGGAGAASHEEATSRQGWALGKWKAYAGSKLCNVLYAKELSRRYGADGSGIVGVAVRPGTVRTGIARHSTVLRVLLTLMYPFLTSVEKVSFAGAGDRGREGRGVGGRGRLSMDIGFGVWRRRFGW